MSRSQKEELQIYPSCKSLPGLIYNWFLSSAQCPALLFCQRLMSKIRNWTKTLEKKTWESLKHGQWIKAFHFNEDKTIWMNTTVYNWDLVNHKTKLVRWSNLFSSDYHFQSKNLLYIYSADLKHQEPLVADIVIITML